MGGVWCSRPSLPRFLNTPPAMRKKVDKAAWEWNAELAALLVNTIKEARAQMPVDEEVLRREFLEKFVPPPSCHPLGAQRGRGRFLMLPFFYLGSRASHATCPSRGIRCAAPPAPLRG